MTTTTNNKPKPSAELWPEGRTLYYEGDDHEGFVRELKKLGLEPTISFHCPAPLLDTLYESVHPLGS